MKNVNILECTLRDGTYVLDFMIEPDVFYSFTKKLIGIGYNHIEVGHGLGLGAYRHYSAGFNDYELWSKLAPLTKQAKLYSFFIPYVGTRDDIDIAAEHGLYGIRIGMEPVYSKKYMDTLEYAKKKGLFVALNFMKSYTVTPSGLAEIVSEVKGSADVVYIVDSAGHMLPGEVRNYVNAIYDKNGMISLGYHGHNNLGLAVANALELIDLGVEYIDTTLTGIGRSGGNVPTEAMVAILARKYRSPFFSNKLLLDSLKLAGEFKEYVLSKGKNFSVRKEDILFGYAGFHSSFENIVRKFAEKRSCDFDELILKVSELEKIRITEEFLDKHF